eukprot:TRINITY_DN56038_c0_g1_i1.p1 TRINITY_DN56038_c0_g1~~TRINITY_DN56038_c0_g1_i1.p1  ORF type:complete len:416 (+),score=83.17 TRINITY_DN56038_c0_g1_i1:100-1347(+)
MASGLAGKVRRSTDSDEFDLGGYDQAKCDDFVKQALNEPFELGHMIKLSFVVGGGKLVRQKYSDDLPRLFMCSLTSIGFKDDSAAACEADSGGKFKFQHDTGKNLKFVHVFPRISGPAPAEAGDDEADAVSDKPLGPDTILFRSSEREFSRLVDEHVITYTQKKALLELLKERISRLEAIEGKMARLVALAEGEQEMFDDVGADELRQKVKLVSAELQQMVKDGKLTSSEKASFVEQMEEKISAVDGELAKAEADAKPKKVQALTQQRQLLQEARTAAKDSPTVNLPQLRHSTELKKLYAKMAVLARIEKASKGNYTMDELKRLGERSEIEEAISVLQERSRGWFEDDATFDERVAACVRSATAGTAGAKKAGGGGGSGSGGGGGGYTTVGSGGGRQSKAKGSAPTTRNAFGALG